MRPPRRRLAGGTAAFAILAACSAPAALGPSPAPSTTTTPEVSSTVVIPTPPPLVDPPGGRELAYGPHPLQRFDVFVPAGDGPHPLFLWLHGGGWVTGDKSELPFRDLVDEGIAVASTNYRSALSEYPDTFVDPGLALSALLADADLAIDPERVVVAGFSSGAHLAALLALTGDVPVAGLMSFAGPLDLRDLTNVPGDQGRGAAALMSLLLDCPPADCPDRLADASPVTLVDADAPPTFLQHGEADPLVAPVVSERFAAALEDVGVAVELELIENGGHLVDRTDAVDAFLRRTLAADA